MSAQNLRQPASFITTVANLYLARRDRRDHPTGSFDRGGRFRLDSEERCSCCRGIRTPSARWPYSEMIHARTATHIAALCDVEERELRRAARQLDN